MPLSPLPFPHVAKEAQSNPSVTITLSAMSVEVLISPRISFSHDLRETENESSAPIQTYPYSSSSLDTGFDFDFAFSVDVHGGLVRETSTADELFSDGKLLPNSLNLTQHTETSLSPSSSLIFPCFKIDHLTAGDCSTSTVSPCLETEKKIVKSLKEYLEDSFDTEDSESPPVSQSSAIRAFWKFRRSNSLNSGAHKAKLNIPSNLRLLSRSKSTGFGIVSLSSKPVKEEDAEEETKPERSSFWKSNQNRGGLMESLKIILLRSNSSGAGLANSKTESANEKQCGISRSCSLNCNGHNRNRGLIMGRSKSTGSSSNLKQVGINNAKKELKKQNSAKFPSSFPSAKQKKEKGQGRKSFKDFYGSCNKSERVNSVLNLPSPYISRVSVDFLGFGSLFCSTKSRKVKK